MLILSKRARLLREADRTVLSAGGGAVIPWRRRNYSSSDERLSAPVAQTISGKGSIGEDIRLAVGVVGFQTAAHLKHAPSSTRPT